MASGWGSQVVNNPTSSCYPKAPTVTQLHMLYLMLSSMKLYGIKGSIIFMLLLLWCPVPSIFRSWTPFLLQSSLPLYLDPKACLPLPFHPHCSGGSPIISEMLTSPVKSVTFLTPPSSLTTTNSFTFWNISQLSWCFHLSSSETHFHRLHELILPD